MFLIGFIVFWIICGVLTTKIRHGWIYHNLYPVYPVLGTPDEQWNRSIEKFGLVKNWSPLIYELIFGPFSLIGILITSIITINPNISKKIKMFKYFPTKIKT